MLIAVSGHGKSVPFAASKCEKRLISARFSFPVMNPQTDAPDGACKSLIPLLKKTSTDAEAALKQLPGDKELTAAVKTVAAIIKNLAGRGQSRPRKVRTLANTINSLFAENLSDEHLSELIAELEKQGRIKVNDGNVTYPRRRRS